MASSSLSGPRLAALQGPASHLVVLLHGYGSDGNDLMGLAPHWQKQAPGACFVAPNAPQRLAGMPGYAWFPISEIAPEAMREGAETALPLLETFIADELTRLSLGPARLVLVGFSQGAMLALHLGLRRAVPPAGIIGLSGLLPEVPQTKGGEPPVFLAHGDADERIPPQAMLIAASQLGECGYRVQWHLAPGVGHGIDAGTMAWAGAFLNLAVRGLLAQPETA